MPKLDINVRFKQGTQAQLAGATKVAGAFYLTTDTNRLFYCDGTNFKDLNQYIHSVAAVENLPTSNVVDGDFYYAESENILCRYDSSKTPAWVQINPDHNTELTPSTSGLSVSSVTGSQVTGAQVGMVVADSSGKEVTGNFQILGSSNITITPDTEHKTITITTPDNVNTTYTLSSTASNGNNQGAINLTPSGTNPQTQTITLAGGDNITVNDNGSGLITISGQPSVDGVSQAFDINGKLTTTITQGTGNDVSNTTTGYVTPTISYGQTATNAVFANGTATLSVYTQAEVDSKINNAIQVADAMTFKGVLGASDNVPTSQVKLGDTYKLAAPKNSITNSKTGDLIIATGEEGDDGYITAATLDWALVPSGDDQLLIADNDDSINKFGIIDTNTTNNDNTINSFTLNQDSTTGTSKIGISATESQSGNGIDFVLSHGAAGTTTATAGDASKTAAVTQTVGTSITVPIVTSIARDTHGHVTGATAANYTFTDTHATMDDFSYSVSVPNTHDSAAFTLGTGLDNNADHQVQQVINSSTLAISTASVTAPNGVDDAAGISIDVVWESF